MKKLLRYIKYNFFVKKTGDDFGYWINKPKGNKNPYKYAEIYKRFESIIKEFNLDKMKTLVGSDFGINPFDLYVLKTFIEKNNIKHVLELGAGTSSRMLDNMKVTRKSYALESIFYPEKFEKLDLFVGYAKVQNYIRKHKIDLILIDCEHSTRMAHLIDKKFLALLNYQIPIFIHDWHNYDKKTYAEQVYYYNNLLSKYDVTYMTDLPKVYIEKLKKINKQLDNETYYKNLKIKKEHLPVRRASVILTPKLKCTK